MKITVTFTAAEIKAILAERVVDTFGLTDDPATATFPGSYSFEMLPATFDVVFDRVDAE